MFTYILYGQPIYGFFLIEVVRQVLENEAANIEPRALWTHQWSMGVSIGILSGV